MAQAAHKTGADEAGFTGAVDALIPRIDIEAFCETAAMATALQDAAGDRRMTRTSVAVAMGGVARAAKTYSDARTPHLLIVETKESGLGVFDALDDLAEVCDPDTKVIVCGPSNDVTLYRELLRQGIDEYIVAPAAPMQVIEAIATVFADPETAPLAKTIGFVGVKGGVGASTLAHNFASMIGRRDAKEVILIDLDTHFGTAGLNFNAEPTRTVVDALGSIHELDDVKLQRLLLEQDEYLSLLGAPARLNFRSDFEDQAVVDLLDLVRRSTDYAVLDIPHSWQGWVRSAITQMDHLVLVAEPDLASLRNLKTMYELLKELRPNDDRPKIVINQVGVAKRPEIAVSDFSDILGNDVDIVMPFDPNLFGLAANNGQMLTEINPRHEAVLKLNDLCDTTIRRSGMLKRKRSGPDVSGITDTLRKVGLGTVADLVAKVTKSGSTVAAAPETAAKDGKVKKKG